jgi:hypothetical protein
MRKRIIACQVFEDALTFLGVRQRFSELTFHFLPAYLHLRPQDLEQQLAAAIADAHRGGKAVCCLYGQCFPAIDATLDRLSVPRVPCDHCFELFLGPDRHRQIVEAVPGSFFLEKHLLLNFDELCWKPLDLHDPELRNWYFKHYRQAIYIRQPLDPDLLSRSAAIAERIGLPLHVEDADYAALDARLNSTLGEDGH